VRERPGRGRVGAEFAGTARYRVIRRLGSGGSGEVYEAWDREWEAPVALKRLARTGARQLLRFKREFRSLANVSHPNLAALYELVVGDDHSFFTMELVEGVDFLTWVRGPGSASFDPSGETVRLSPSDPTVVGEPVEASGRRSEEDEAPVRAVAPVGFFDEVRLRAIALQVCDAVSALHGIGKLHRDLKPSNVLVTGEGRTVVLDFGLVEDFGGRGEPRAEVAGTPGYMAPEQEAGERMTPAGDWYGLGAMLFEALTGIRPRSARQVRNLCETMDPTGLPAELWSLCRDLLRSDPAARPLGPEIVDRLRAGGGGARRLGARAVALSPLVGPGRFVGREPELAVLGEALGASRRLATLVGVHGESGMGKSALLEHFLDGLGSERETLVLRGRCFEQEAVPYKAFDGVVEGLEEALSALEPARLDALMPDDSEPLARLFPVLGRRRGVVVSRPRASEPGEPQLVRQRAFEALRLLLQRISDRQPVVLWIDDLQWADADSLALIHSLLRQPDAPRMLWIVGFRSEELATRRFLRDLVEVEGEPGRRVLRVGALDDAAARRLVASWLAVDSPRLVDAIVREAAGNTFLLQELARHARGFERGEDRPVGLEAVVEARLTAQPTGARRLLETVAVAGRPLRADVAFRAAREERPGLGLVVALRAANLLRTQGSLDRVEIFHDRIREAIAAGLDEARRREIHAGLADAMVELGIDEPDTLFDHHLGAGRIPEAAQDAQVAARRALEALAFDRAAGFLEQALALTPEDDAETRDALALRRAEALAWAGRAEESARAYLDLAARGGSAHALEHRRAAAQQLLLGGYVDEGLEAMGAVLAAVGLRMPVGGRRALLRLAWLRARLALRGVRFDPMLPVEVAERDLLRIDACWAAAAGLGLVDNVRGSIFQTQGLLLSLGAGEPSRVARSLAIEAAYSAAPGRHGQARAERYLDLARTLAHRCEDPHAIGLVHLTGGIVAFLDGDWLRAAERCERALEQLESCRGVLWEITTAYNFLLGALQYLGRLTVLSSEAPARLSAAEAHGNRNAATEIATRFNMVWLIEDDPQRARREVEGAIARWSHRGFHRQHCNALRAQVHIDLYRGDGRVAWERVRAAWPALRRSLLPRIQFVRVETHYLRASSALAAAAAEGLDTGLERDVASAARRLHREDLAWIRPFGLVAEAGLASLVGDVEGAVSSLRAAIGGFEASGAHLWQHAALWRLGALVGGQEGEQARAGAERWFLRRGVVDPERFAWMLAPVGAPVERWEGEGT
jgi:eukaryotic-like serine/threonine-protein kinase